jgi:hypothetical protein
MIHSSFKTREHFSNICIILHSSRKGINTNTIFNLLTRHKNWTAIFATYTNITWNYTINNIIICVSRENNLNNKSFSIRETEIFLYIPTYLTKQRELLSNIHHIQVLIFIITNVACFTANKYTKSLTWQYFSSVLPNFC